MKQKFLRSAAMVLTAAAALPLAAVALAAVEGDANGDGSTTIADAVALVTYLTGEQTTLGDPAAADFNGDDRINAMDLTLLKRALCSQTVTSSDQLVTAITYAQSAVTLYNGSGELVSAEDAENVTVQNGTIVTITQPSEIDVDGTCENGQLIIDCDKTTYPMGQVTCNLRGLTLSHANASPIYVAAIDGAFVLTVKKDTVNTISDGTDYTNADADTGAIYACDDMKIKGKGTLIVNGNCGDGIVCKNDLKIWNGDVRVTAVDDGIRGKDSVRIGDPDSLDDSALHVQVKTMQGDGIKSTSTVEGDGYVRINGGMVTIDAYADGIQAEQSFEMNGGTLDITTYEGSSYTGTGTATGGNKGGWGGMQDGNSNQVDASAKGIKAVGLYDEAGTTYQSAGDITLHGGTITIDSSDDCIHCSGNLSVYGGVMNLATADDALHADHDLTLGTSGGAYSDFEIYVAKCYEGVEGGNIYQYSGTVVVKSDDDGYNAAGGADGSGNTSTGGWGQGGWGGPGGGGSSGNVLEIAGGIVIVQSASGDHDALDSNGPVNISGGIVIANGQEPIDCGDGYSENLTGGVIAEISSQSSGTVSEHTQFTISDASGNVIVSFTTMRGIGSISLNDTSLSCYTGGTIAGGTDLITSDDAQTVYGDGTITDGSAVSTSGSGGNNPWFW